MTGTAAARPLAAVRRVRVGSTNPPKLAAVRAALAPWVETLDVSGVAVPSGVPEQPVGFDEIVAGARNRARAAAASGPCDLAVGIEDGLVRIEAAGAEPLNLGAAVVTDGRRESCALSAAFAYPAACARRAFEEREPIGALFDRLWDERERSALAPRTAADAPSPAVGGAAVPSALSVGNIGKLSLGALPRAEYARHAVVCALLRFLHPDLYVEAAPADEGAA